MKKEELDKVYDEIVSNFPYDKIKLYDNNGRDVTKEYPHLHIGVEILWPMILFNVILPLIRAIYKNPDWKIGDTLDE